MFKKTKQKTKNIVIDMAIKNFSFSLHLISLKKKVPTKKTPARKATRAKESKKAIL
tara:strand:+ start:14823 stop:14990 length:168 start_codon:yes stop_codon:yes gene_type:complete